MNEHERVDRMLAAWADDAWPAPPPAYLDEVLARTRRTRQRPAWASLERWLPMGLTLQRPMLALPMRLLAVMLTLLLLLIAAMSVPFLFGGRSFPATVVTGDRNGLIAFGRDGDIWVVDPDVGEPRVLIGGRAVDGWPDWSPDGTRIAFWRMVGARYDLWVADADGSNQAKVTPEPLADDAAPWWSPDGSMFVISSTVDGVPSVSLVNADGTDFRTLDLGHPATGAAWHPDGRSLLVRLQTPEGTGLFPVAVPDGTLGEPIAMSDTTSAFYAADRGAWDLKDPSYSADGSMIAYFQGQLPLDGQSGAFGGWDLRDWVMVADGTGARMVEYAVDSDYENVATWAPFGTRLAMIVKTGDTTRVVIADATDRDPMVASEPTANAEGVYHLWSPDGTMILVVREIDSVASLVDTTTGVETTLPWLAGPPSWQHVRP